MNTSPDRFVNSYNFINHVRKLIGCTRTCIGRYILPSNVINELHLYSRNLLRSILYQRNSFFFFLCIKNNHHSFFSPFPFTLTVFLRSSGAPFCLSLSTRRAAHEHPVALRRDDATAFTHSLQGLRERGVAAIDRPTQPYLPQGIARVHTRLFSARSVFRRQKNNITHTRRNRAS